MTFDLSPITHGVTLSVGINFVCIIYIECEVGLYHLRLPLNYNVVMLKIIVDLSHTKTIDRPNLKKNTNGIAKWLLNPCMGKAKEQNYINRQFYKIWQWQSNNKRKMA